MVLECRVDTFLAKNKDVIKKRNKYFFKRSQQKVTLPCKESKELCRLLGIIHGDGNLSCNRIVITERYKEAHEMIANLFKKLFSVKVNLFQDKKRNSYYSHIKNKMIYKFLTEVLELPNGAIRESLKLPKFIKKISFKMQREYVGGLFDAEGWLTKRQAHIGFSMTNKEIRDFVSDILIKSKIKHTISFRNRRKNKEYEIHIYGKENLKRFQKEIGFTHYRKINQLTNHI